MPTLIHTGTQVVANFAVVDDEGNITETKQATGNFQRLCEQDWHQGWSDLQTARQQLMVQCGALVPVDPTPVPALPADTEEVHCGS